MSKLQLEYMAITDLADAIEKNSLTIEEIIIISRIHIGCTKIALEASNRAQKNLKRVTRKLRASARLQYELSGGKKEKFKPSDIKELLPDDLNRFDQADLTDILRAYIEANWLVKSSPPTVTRGRPSEQDRVSERGIKSYYENSGYLEAVKKVISRPEILKIVLKFLVESRVIQMYLASVYLYSFVSIRHRGFEGTRGIYDIVAKQFGKLLDREVEQKIQVYHEEIINIKRENLELIAGTMARNWLKNCTFHYDPIFVDFCLHGGMSYQA